MSSKQKRLSEFHVGNFDDSNLDHLDGLQRRGLMLALSSPSGAGKTTMSRLLLDADPDVRLSISATTRERRPGETEGEHYHFVSLDKFNSMIAAGELLEHAKFVGNLYGTPRAPVEAILATGKDMLFDIEWQGVRQLAAVAREDLVSVFILPPSTPELERRLHSRARDDAEVIKRRMDEAASEISHYHEYDYVIINRNLEDSMLKLRTILGAERMKRTRLNGLDEFVGGLHSELEKRRSEQN